MRSVASQEPVAGAMSAPTTTEAGLEGKGAGRLPALDGLRAMAVVLVLAFHAGITSLRGGFIGVDIFFVLSGFVVVRSLVREFDDGGRVDLAAFWRRRVARLAPAAIACVVIGGAVFTLFSSPPERVAVVGDGRAALLFISNWWFLHQSADYFRGGIDSSPFLHMWSLSVEEQFYVVLPLCFIAAFRWLRVARNLLLAVALAAAFATAWNIVNHGRFSELRIYFGTDTRIYQLLWGATAAIALSQFARVGHFVGRTTANATLLIAGMLGLAWLSWADDIDPNTRGLFATMVALALICSLATRPSSVAASVFAFRPVRSLGEMSYGLYLWHWPVIIVLGRLFVMGNRTLFAVATVVSVVLAYSMRHVLELPIIAWSYRKDSGPGWRKLIGILAIPVMASVFLVPLVLPVGPAPLAAVSRPGFSIGMPAGARHIDVPVPRDLGVTGFAPFEKGNYCINTPNITGDCLMVDGGPTKVLVVGDSHADDLLPGLSILARSKGLSLYAVVTAGCPWQNTLAYVGFDTPSCVAAQNAVYNDLVDRVRPDIIVVASHPHEYPGFEVKNRQGSAAAVAIEGPAFAEATAKSARLLTRNGARLVMIEPRPSSPFNAQTCLAASAYIDDCAFVAGPQAAAESARLRSVAVGIAGFTTVNVQDLVCPRFPVCDPILRGLIVRYDFDHLYSAFVQRIADQLWERILTSANTPWVTSK